MTFGYARPLSLEEAVQSLAEMDGRARPLAGGTDLLVQLRAERFDLDRVVDVKSVPELNELRFSLEGLTIGAAVPCYRIYEHSAVQADYVGLIDAVSILGGIAIQGRATLGGNLCNASPSADSTPILLVMGSTCSIAGPNGMRTIPVKELATGPGVTSLQPGELLTQIHIPPPPPHSGAAYLRFTPRHEMDIAVASAGAWVELSPDRRMIVEARLALGAVGPTALEVDLVGEMLFGGHGSEEALEKVAERARETAQPITDMRGSAAQRRHLVGVLAKRALVQALDRAKSWG